MAYWFFLAIVLILLLAPPGWSEGARRWQRSPQVPLAIALLTLTAAGCVVVLYDTPLAISAMMLVVSALPLLVMATRHRRARSGDEHGDPPPTRDTGPSTHR